MTISQLRENAHSALAQGDIDEALMLLVSYLRAGSDSSTQYDSALIIKAKWETIKRDHLNGTISRSEYELAMAKTIVGIQTITNDLGPNSRRLKYDEPPLSPAFKSNKFVWIAGVVLLTIISIFAFKAFTGEEQVAKNPNLPTTLGELTPPKSGDYERLVKKAQSLFDKGAYKMALDTINAALSLSEPDKTASEAIRDKCEAELVKKSKLNEESKEKQRKYQEYKRQADDFFAQKNVRQAREYYEKALALIEAKEARANFLFCNSVISGGTGTYLKKPSARACDVIYESEMTYFDMGEKSVKPLTQYCNCRCIILNKDDCNKIYRFGDKLEVVGKTGCK